MSHSDATTAPLPSFKVALAIHMGEAGDDVTSLADRAGVSRDALYKVTYGKTETPKLDLVMKVAAAYGKSVEEFMRMAPAGSRVLDELGPLTASERSILLAVLQALRAQSADPSPSMETTT